jgi:hypothetical protein
LRRATFLNARSNGPSVSGSPSSRAASMKRLDCSGSSRCVSGLRSIADNSAMSPFNPSPQTHRMKRPLIQRGDAPIVNRLKSVGGGERFQLIMLKIGTVYCTAIRIVPSVTIREPSSVKFPWLLWLQSTLIVSPGSIDSVDPIYRPKLSYSVPASVRTCKAVQLHATLRILHRWLLFVIENGNSNGRLASGTGAVTVTDVS